MYKDRQGLSENSTMRSFRDRYFNARSLIFICIAIAAIVLVYKSVLDVPTHRIASFAKDVLFDRFGEQVSRFQCLAQKISPDISKALERVGDGPQQHIAFVKVHKSASSTLQNVFYRYGIARNLSFALPKAKYELRFSRDRGHHAELIPPPDGATKYDILANHAVFDEKIFDSYLHKDTIYVAIMREPTHNFISGVLYFTYKYPQPYLKKIPKAKLFSDLIRHPEVTEPKNLRQTFTYNIQANDLGLTLDRIKRIPDQNVTDYLDKLNNIFSLVLLAEHFDASLVLMKRYLRWDLKDILFINVNEFHKVPVPKLTTVEKKLLRERNYLDYMFYDFFYKRFWRHISCEHADIMEEAAYFHSVRESVEEFCTDRNKTSNVYLVPSSKWNTAFLVAAKDCLYMQTAEMDFFTNLQKIQTSRQTRPRSAKVDIDKRLKKSLVAANVH